MERWIATWEQLLRSDGEMTAYALVAVVLLTGIELIAPAENGQSWTGRARNLVYLVLYKVLGLGGMALWLAFGPRPFLLGYDPTPFGAGLLIVANLVVNDLFYYAYHRAQHRFRFLWAIHELHHSDAELNATTSYRTYWLESLVQTIVVTTPTVFFFGNLGARHVLIVITISLGFLIFTHCNVRLSLGPLTPFLCGPQVHRIHHSKQPEHRDRNFAQFFPFLDWLFGSYYPPAPGEFPPTGAPDLASDAPVWRAMVQPFAIWRKQLRLRPSESRSRKAG